MKKVVRKLNRVLSVLLTAAMVAGSVPEAGFTVNAAGLESETEAEVLDLDGQEPDDQDADDSQDTDDVQDPGDQDTGDVQDPGDQDTNDQNSGDDQSADDQDVNDGQDDDSMPDNGNTEEDKESETATAETNEPVSTEASDDNTAGKEDEVQDDESIAPKGESDEEGDEEPEETGSSEEPTESTVTIDMTDMKEVRYVFSGEKPDADYDFCDKVPEGGKINIGAGKLYILATPKNNIEIKGLKNGDGELGTPLNIKDIDGAEAPQKAFIIESLDDVAEISFEVEKTFDINLKAATDTNIKSVKYYYKESEESAPSETKFLPLTSDTKLSIKQEGKLFLIIEPAVNYDVVIKEKAGTATEPTALKLSPKGNVYEYVPTKDAELTFEANAKDAITVEADSNVTKVEYAFGSSVPNDYKNADGNKIITKDAENNLYVKITTAESYAVKDVVAVAKPGKTVTKPAPEDGNPGVYKISKEDIANIDKITISAKKDTIKVIAPDGVTVSHKKAAVDDETEAGSDGYIALTGDKLISFDGSMDLQLKVAADGLVAAQIKVCDQNGSAVTTTTWTDVPETTRGNDKSATATIDKSKLTNVTELHFTVGENATAQAAVTTKVVYDGIDDVADVNELVDIKNKDNESKLSANTKADFNKPFVFNAAMASASGATKEIAKVTCKFGNGTETTLEASKETGKESLYTTANVAGAVTITVYVKDITHTAKIVNNTDGKAVVKKYITNDDVESESTDYGFDATQDIKVVTGKKFGFVFTVSDDETPIVTKVTKDTGDSSADKTVPAKRLKFVEASAEDANGADGTYVVSEGVATYTVKGAAVEADTTYTITLDDENTTAKFTFVNGAPTTATNKTDVTNTKIEFEEDGAKVTGDNTTGWKIGFNKDLKFKVVPADGSNMEVTKVEYTVTPKTVSADGDSDTPPSQKELEVGKDEDSNSTGIYTLKKEDFASASAINFTVTLAKKTAEVTVTDATPNIVVTKYDYIYQETAQPGKETIGSEANANKVDLGSELTIYYKVNNSYKFPDPGVEEGASIQAVDDVLPKITKTVGTDKDEKTTLLSWEEDTSATPVENDTFKYYKVKTTIDDESTKIAFAIDHKEVEYYEVGIKGDAKDYVKITSDCDEIEVGKDSDRKILVEKKALTFKLTPDYDVEALNREFTVKLESGTDVNPVVTELKPVDGIYTVAAYLITDSLVINVSKAGLSPAEDIGINNKADSKAFDTSIEYKAASMDDWEDLDRTTVVRGAGIVGEDFKLRFRKNEDFAVTVKVGEETLTAGQDGLYTVYSYNVKSDDANKRITFVITAEDIAPRAALQSENLAKLTITSAVVGSKDVLGQNEPNADGKMVWKLDSDSDVLELKLEAATGYIIDSVTGGSIDKTKTTATVKIKAGSTADVAVKAAYAAVVEEPQAATLTADGKYIVAYNVTAKISLKNGETTKNVSKVVAKAGSKTLTEEQAKVNSNKAEIVFAEYAGKTVTADLYTMEEQPAAEDGTKPDPKEVKAATVTFDVSAKLTEITVSGVKKGKELTQLVGTSKKYDITVAPKKALADIVLAVENPDVATVTLNDDKTKLTIIPKKFASTKITLTSGTGEDAVSFDFTLNAEASGVAGKAASAKIKYTSDSDYTITLGSIAKLPELTVQDAEYAYKVVTTNGVEPILYFSARAVDRDVKVKLLNDPLTDAQKEGGQSFDVTVTLVQVSSHVTDKATSISGEFKESDKATSLTVTTKKAYYTTKLKLKKGAATVYTGQSGVVVASPVFDTPATYVNIKAEDITPNGTRISDSSFSYENNQVVANVGRSVTLGKHTIRVTASDDVKGTMYAASADITVTVVRGIDELELSVPSTIYKADSKKNITYTVKPVYNGGDTNKKPKTAKVKDWTVVNKKTGKADPYVSIKNGKLTIDKRYVLAGDDASNTFTVTATAADFPGNTTPGTADFTITAQPAVIKDIVLVKSDQIVARDNATVAPRDIHGASVVALRTNAPVSGNDVSAYERISGYNLTYTSSNKNAVAISADGVIEVKKPANNVRITVKTNDGSKLTKFIKINVGYAQTGDLGIEVYRIQDDAGYNAGDTFEGKEPMESAYITDLSFIGSTAEKFGIKIMKRDTEEDGLSNWRPLDDYTDVKAVVSGAVKTLKFSDGKTVRGTYGDEQVFVLTGEKATIKLVDNKNKQIAGKTYTITNTGFVKTGKAPSVKLNAKSYMTGYNDIGMTLGSINGYPYAEKILFARVETDQTAVNSKNYDGYYYLNRDNYEDQGVLVEQRINDDGTIVIPSVRMYMAGSFKLKVTVGEKNSEGIFTPIAKTANVTLKVTAPKAAKVGSSLTFKMSMKDPEITLPTSFGKVLNANDRGTPNSFSKYFEFGSGKNKLRLTKDAFTDSELTENLVGYLAYGNSTSNAVKVTIKIVDAPITKYSANALNLISGSVPTDGITTPVYLGKDEVHVVKAAVDSETNKTSLSVKESGDGRITFTGSADKGNYTVKVWVVPDTSSYYQTLTAAEQAAVKAEEWGIPVNVTVKVAQADSASKMIALGANKAAFTVNGYSESKGYTAGYDRMNQNYWINIPYTKNMSNAEVDSIVNGAAETAAVRKIAVNKAENGNSIEISLPAASVKDLGYNKTVKVPLLVTYKNGGKEGGDKSYSLNLTTPAQFTSNYNDAVNKIDEAKEKIQKSIVPQVDNDRLNTDDTKNILVGSYRKYELDAISTAVQDLNSALLAEIKNDTGVVIEVPEITYDIQGNITGGYEWVANETYTRPQKTEAGVLKVNVKIYDMAQTKLSTSGAIDTATAVCTVRTFVLNIPKLKAQADDLDDFADRWENLDAAGAKSADITKATTREALLKAIRDDLDEWNETGKADEQYDLSNIRLRIDGFGYDEDEKTLSAVLVVTDIIGGEEEYPLSYEFEEDDNIADTMKTAEGIVSGLSNSAALGANMSSAAAAKEFIKKQVEAGIKGDSIKVDDKTLVKAITEKTTVGDNTTTKITSFEVTLVLKKDGKILRSSQAIKITCPDANVVTAFNAAKEAVTADSIKTIAAGITPEDPAAGYTTEELEKAILDKANATLSEALKATYKFVKATGYTLTAPSIDSNGKAVEGKGNVKLKLVANTNEEPDVLSPTDIISIENIILAAEIDRQTLAQAKTAADKAIEALTVGNATDKAAIETAVSAVISTKYTIAWQKVDEDKVGNTGADDAAQDGVDNFKNTPATVKEVGTIKGAFYIRLKTAADNTGAQKVTIDRSIAKQPQSDAAAYTAVKGAIDTAKSKPEGLTKASLKTAIEAVLDTTKYTIDDSGLTETAASATASGSLKGVIKIKVGSNVIRTFTDLEIETKVAQPETPTT